MLQSPRIVDACRQGNLLTITLSDGRAYTFPAAIPEGLTDTQYTRHCVLEASSRAWDEDAARGKPPTILFAEAS